MKTKNKLGETTRILPVVALALSMAITVALGAGETVQWDVVDGGGGISTGGTNTLWSSVVQDSTYVVATGATNEEYQGYIIPLPDDAAVYCQNGGVDCAGPPTYYGTANPTFTFSNNACGTAPGTPCAFDRRATSYYRYLWQQSATCDSAALNAGSTWSDQNYFCPGGACTKLGTSMTLNATLDGDWYLCARSYNGGIIGTTQVLGPYQYDSAGPAISNLDANNVDYSNLYVDGTFDLSADVQDTVSKLKDGTCEYRCVGTGGLCDGTWRAAADNWSGTGTSNGVCSAANVTCTVNNDALAIYLRVQDNANNTTTSAAINRTCDIQQPTCSIGTISESAANVYYPGAGTTLYYCNNASCGNNGTFSVTVTATDAVSGMQKVNFPSPNSLTGCGDDTGSPFTCAFSFTSATTQSGAVTETSYDNVNNTNTCSYTLTRDTTAPAGGSISYTDGWYTGGTVTVTMTNGTDGGSGIPGTPGRLLQRQSATLTNGACGAYGAWGTIATDPASPYNDSPTAGNCYMYRYVEYDNVNNSTAYTSASVAKISGGAYLHISQIDSDGTDDPEGILATGNTDIERVIVQILNENDQVITSGSISTKSVTVTLGNLGTTGAYIYETHAGLTGGTPTFVTVNLVNGEGWYKIKSNGTEDPDAITVTPSAAGLSSYGGRDQSVFLLVRDSTGLSWAGDTNATLATAVAGDLIVNPVWSHSGDKIAYYTHEAGVWNIYKKTYSGSWGSAIRLTNSNMRPRPGAVLTWSGDDQYVTFSVTDDIDGNNELELYAVKTTDNGSVGDDAAKTLTTLRSENKRLTNLAYSATNRRRWADSDWSRTTCVNGFSDDIVASMSAVVNQVNKASELYVINGTKDANGLYIEDNGGSSATITQLTDFPGFTFAIQPRWSNDCSKIVFVVLDGVGTQTRSSIYVMNITDAAWGARVNGGALPATPITSLTASGMFKIHECTTATCAEYPAIYPTFSADDTFLLYAIDKTSTFDVRGLQQDDIKGQFYTGKNFNNYATYIQDHSYVKQEIGQSANNEFGLSQCSGATCPDSAQGKPIVYITQSGTTQGDLRILYLDTESTVTTNGGLMFMKGAVAAVIKPGALKAETKLEVTDPVGAPGSPDGTALLVDTGIAREFFPDGVVFNEDVLLLFHYCDTDSDGFLDVRQNDGCTGGTGGSSGLDENKLYVYYWCDAGTGGTRNCTDSTWQKLNGSVDPTRNMVSVATNHFSVYDVKALLRGLAAPQVVRELYLSNPHTFPNPWRQTDGLLYFNIDGDSSFNTQAEGTAGVLTVSINVYDIRGQLVRSINNSVTGLATLAGSVDGSRSSSGRGLDIASWDVTNNGGRPLASGVYLYHLTVSDGVFTRDVTGKLAITR